ncbi:MAG TPA: ABC transporter permease [Acidobacteriota bacterium]|nr:ABC transporter permease [Acidobacteriota bacterium]
MTFRDCIATSTGNLWRMKLRASLTVSGVVIAIAAFVSMLSFGAGMQKMVADQFEKFGLFSTTLVYPPRGEGEADSVAHAVLDDAAIVALSQIPGVKLAYPLDAFDVTAAIADTTIRTEAQALPTEALGTKLYSDIVAGSTLTTTGTDGALVTEDLLERLGIGDPDSVLGLSLVVSVEQTTIDSGLVYVFRGGIGRMRQLLAGLTLDSLNRPEYVRRKVGQVASDAMARFLNGFLSARAVVSDTLVVRGVLRGQSHGRARIRPIVAPTATALRFNAGGFVGNPTDLFAALQTGMFPSGGDGGTQRSYPRVTLDLETNTPYQPIRDSVEALGFRVFSYAEEFDEIREFFFYFNMVLGVIGLIALITASLGIVNTMVMSIVERTREIGVLKSLGADDRDIRRLFLVESGLIGAVGASAGIVFGWLITRLASVIARSVMESRGVPEMELFALPLWLIGTALVFGIVVSLIAGSYPAARAARVDPVRALRAE